MNSAVDQRNVDLIIVALNDQYREVRHPDESGPESIHIDAVLKLQNLSLHRDIQW